jgi:rubrerythrin
VGAAEADVAGLEAIHKRFEDIFKGRRERLGTRREETGKLKEDAERMAMVRFGLAMAKTPGRGLSGVLSGLTAGAEAGTQEYAKGMDKYRAAQEKLNEAEDRLEELEATRGEMNARELHKGRMGVRKAVIDSMQLQISANMDMYKLNREDGKELAKAQVQYGVAQMQASSRGGSGSRPLDIKGLYTQAVLKGNKPQADKLYEILQKIGEANKPGLDAKSRSDFMKDNKRELDLINNMSRSEDPKTMKNLADRKAALRESAIASGIDPNTISALSGAGVASSTGQRTLQWNDIIK